MPTKENARLSQNSIRRGYATEEITWRRLSTEGKPHGNYVHVFANEKPHPFPLRNS